MIFDSKIDERLNTCGIKQVSFNIKKCHDYYLEKFLENGYIDLTSEFIKRDFQNLESLLYEYKSVLQLNKLYDHFSKLKEPANLVTMRYHAFLNKITNNKLENNTIDLVGLSYNRTIIEAQKTKQSINDELLLCDFVNFYIKPQYFEFKMFAKNEKTFNQYQAILNESGIYPISHNKVFIQNMKTRETFVYKYN